MTNRVALRRCASGVWWVLLRAPYEAALICTEGVSERVHVPADLKLLDIVFTEKPRAGASFKIVRDDDNDGVRIVGVRTYLLVDLRELLEEHLENGLKYFHFEYS